MIVCWAVSVMSSSLRTIAWVRRCVVTAWGPLRRRNLCVSLRHVFATDVCRVKELADVAGTTVRTVRHYHHVGSLPGLAAARGRATTGLTTSRGLSASAGWARPRGAARQRGGFLDPDGAGKTTAGLSHQHQHRSPHQRRKVAGRLTKQHPRRCIGADSRFALATQTFRLTG